VLKRELLRIPFFGWGLALLKPVPIDRTVPLKAIRRVKVGGVSRLREGINVLVFPEGTRMPVGEVGYYARSGADIACAAGVPVVPVAHDAGRCWPKQGILKSPGVITIVIGEPMPTAGRSSKEVTDAVREWIEARVVEIELNRTAAGSDGAVSAHI
jgi:1-acyl-sn-glycerol-3-phosphate acyltransferase